MLPGRAGSLGPPPAGANRYARARLAGAPRSRRARVSDPRPHRFAVEFGPQRPATASLAATLAALAVVAALLVRGRWWR